MKRKANRLCDYNTSKLNMITSEKRYSKIQQIYKSSIKLQKNENKSVEATNKKKLYQNGKLQFESIIGSKYVN